MINEVNLDRNAIADFCRRWAIAELALFGSVLTDRFGPESDIDFLVTFDPRARWGYFDLVRIERELGEIVGRRVDVVTRKSVERSRNKIFREHALALVEPIYVA
jgi:predicted nucleotidyltransferase